MSVTRGIHDIVTHTQSSLCTILHCLYGLFYLSLSVSKLATIYAVSKTTIYNWIKRNDSGDLLSNKHRLAIRRKFSEDKIKYIVEYFSSKPLAYLDEAKKAFFHKYNQEISVASVWRIIHSHGMTRKVVENRAIQIKISDELLKVPWLFQNLVFIDEVGFNHRDMIRKRGYR
jgi:transposase